MGGTAVRIPLNEDCWLGINGQPNSSEGADPPLTSTGYQQAIKTYVADLNKHGLYAVLDLHWSAPGSQVAFEQQPMPDQDHSPAFWTSVASVFRNNPAVVFDLFNEPYDPTDPRSGDDSNANDKVTWNCWEIGTHDGTSGGTPCTTSAYDENGDKTTTYRVAGLQTLLNSVRNAGARQPVLLGGLDFANDLGDNNHGQAWIGHEPHDPLHQVAASFHNYMGKACATVTCWNSAIAPIATHVPVVTGEFDEDNFDEPNCPDKTPSSFDNNYMNWSDKAGVSYLAWGWIVESQAERDAERCGAFYLINNYSQYTPAQPNGVAVHDHLRALAAPPPPVTLTTFSAAVRPGNKTAAFTLRSPENASGTLSGTTVHSYVIGSQKAHRVSLGAAVSFTLKGRTAKAVVVTFSRTFHNLLVAKNSVEVQITTTLTSPHHSRAVIHRTFTLRAKRLRG